MSDLKFAIRQLFKSPGFTCVAVLTLGLCIGANLAIFAAVDAILVRSLPFPEPERLIVVYNAYPGSAIERGNASIANYFDRRDNIEAFESVSMLMESPEFLSQANSPPQPVECARVTPEFFQTLGVPLARGRAFTGDEMTPSSAGVAIISDRFWRTYFHADPHVLGRTYQINVMDSESPRNGSISVIGVLPPGFRYLSSRAQIYRPLFHHLAFREPYSRHYDMGQMIARLAANRSFAVAEAQLAALNAQLLPSDPQGKSTKKNGSHTWVTSLHQDHVRSVKPVLLLLQAGVLCLLLIGAVNLAGLLLIRASGRMKEIAVRKALGASRRRITVSILVETILLSLGGGALGIVLSVLGIRLLRLLGTDALPMGADITFDGRSAIVSILVSIAVGVCIAVPIIWLNLRERTHVHLQSESRGGTVSQGVQRLRHAFIATQIAIAFVLLCGAGMLGVSLKQTLEVSPGFEPEHVATCNVTLPFPLYPDSGARTSYINQLLAQLRAIPGVTHAAAASTLLFRATQKWRIRTEEFDPAAGGAPRAHYLATVTPGYWRVMNIPLLQGRFFEGWEREHENQPSVAVVDEAFARHYWPEGDAIGRRFSADPTRFDPDSNETHTIVGIVGSVKQDDLVDTEELGTVYLPIFPNSYHFHVILRTSGSDTALLRTMQKVISQLDPGVPGHDFKTMQAYIDDSLVIRRSPAILALVFAAVALLLASIGIYGALAYAVAQRRREIGVRMALGAMPKQIGGQFLSLGLRLLVVGTLLGCVGAWTTGRAIQSLLFEVPSLHLPTLAGTALVIGVVTLLACLLPARRASRVDPMEVLRSE